MADQLERMYDVAHDDELATLDALADRAALLWKCEAEQGPHGLFVCGHMNPMEAERCEACRTTKPGVAA